MAPGGGRAATPGSANARQGGGYDEFSARDGEAPRHRHAAGRGGREEQASDRRGAQGGGRPRGRPRRPRYQGRQGRRRRRSESRRRRDGEGREAPVAIGREARTGERDVATGNQKGKLSAGALGVRSDPYDMVADAPDIAGGLAPLRQTMRPYQSSDSAVAASTSTAPVNPSSAVISL